MLGACQPLSKPSNICEVKGALTVEGIQLRRDRGAISGKPACPETQAKRHGKHSRKKYTHTEGHRVNWWLSPCHCGVRPTGGKLTIKLTNEIEHGENISTSLFSPKHKMFTASTALGSSSHAQMEKSKCFCTKDSWRTGV